MTDELNERFNDVVRKNAELTVKLEVAETEIGNLKSELLTLSEKLEDANNEMGRMGMVLKHRAKDMQSQKRLDKQNEWLLGAARHH